MSGLFGFLKQRRGEPKVPDGTRVYAIGDIHGRADLLTEMLELIRNDAADHGEGRKVLVFIGDYVDRGLHSKEVIDLVLDRAPPAFEVVCLRGNHEAMMLEFLDRGLGAEVWLQNGGNATLFSYGVQLDERGPYETRIAKAREELAANLPDRHAKFLHEELVMSHAEGDYLFVHAGVRPGVSLEDQDDAELLWIRDEFLDSGADHGKIVVHGHSIAWDPDVRDNRIGIDTGAFASGVLTCLVLDGRERSFLQTATAHPRP